MASIIRKFQSRTENTRSIVGDTKTSFTESDHLGWLKCDGRMLTVADYMSLFKVIGYTFGGSGNQFKLPDMRGRVAGMAGKGDVNDDMDRTLTTRAKGQYRGEEVHQLTIAELAAHNHGVATGGQTAGNNTTSINGRHSHTIDDIGFGTQYVTGAAPLTGATAMDETVQQRSTDFQGNHVHELNPAGNDAPHNNMQPTLFLGNTFIYCNKVYEGAGHLTTDTDII